LEVLEADRDGRLVAWRGGVGSRIRASRRSLEVVMATDYRLRFWGVRGTVATPAADKLRYGGNTPCAAVELSEDEYIILDCGTGVRNLGVSIAKRRAGRPTRIHIFLSHYHLDHIEGLSLFQPLYEGANTIVFHGFAADGRTVRNNLETLIAPPYFPLRLAGVPASVKFKDVDGSTFEVADIRVDTMPLCHPDGSVAFRLTHGERRLVFATDHEYGVPEIDRALADFSRRASYLIYDATYMPAEYDTLRKGWGHSTWFAAVQAARAAEVERLVLFQHHPEHTDEQLDEIERITQAEIPTACVAQEGMELPF
jgi:phosphoribosyl 1,2-cyclic phosphodiesterase